MLGLEKPSDLLLAEGELAEARREIERLRTLVEASKLINSSIEPDALFVFIPSGEGLAVMKQFEERGLKQAGVRLIGTGDLTDDGVLQAMGRGLADVGIYESSLGPIDMPTSHYRDDRLVVLAPRGREFVRLPWTTPHPIAEPLRAIVNRSTSAQVRLRYRSARTFLGALTGWVYTAAIKQPALLRKVDRLSCVRYASVCRARCRW